MSSIRFLTIRPHAVAGSFYPAGTMALADTVDRLLERFGQECPGRMSKALLVPHAGYAYSGATAAAAYAELRQRSAQITRVVLLGPAHHVALLGLALPDVQAFSTPLGLVEIDQEALQGLAGLPQVVRSASAHAREHALEVQLPFLQRLLGSFRLLPFAVGQASDVQIAEVLERLWGGPETLIVISSDLSHYHPYGRAAQIDHETVRRILLGVPLYSMEQACGAVAINGMLLAARRRRLQPFLIHQCNSGDTAGERGRVVGYAAISFRESVPADEPQGHADRGRILLSIARSAISTALGRHETGDESAAWLREPGAAFVTLQRQGRLRGCIGSLEPHRRLLDDIKANAVAAATLDRRFPPVTIEELAELEVEVSLLSPKQPISFTSEQDLIGQLEAGLDGLILEFRHHRGTFLPQVWQELPDPRRFLAQLKRKAGLPADFWSSDLRMYRYRVEKWSEANLS